MGTKKQKQKRHQLLACGMGILLALFVTACDGGNPSGAGSGVSDGIVGIDPVEELTDTEERENLLDWFAGGVYSYDFVYMAEVDGISAELTGTLAVEYEEAMVVLNNGVDAERERYFLHEGAIWLVNDTDKTRKRVEGTLSEACGGLVVVQGEPKAGVKGIGEFKGRSLKCQDFEYDDLKLRYFIDSEDVVCGLIAEKDGYRSETEISSVISQVIPGFLKFPDSYSEIL
jgi:hypothetical protein